MCTQLISSEGQKFKTFDSSINIECESGLIRHTRNITAWLLPLKLLTNLLKAIWWATATSYMHAHQIMQPSLHVYNRQLKVASISFSSYHDKWSSFDQKSWELKQEMKRWKMVIRIATTQGWVMFPVHVSSGLVEPMNRLCSLKPVWYAGCRVSRVWNFVGLRWS